MKLEKILHVRISRELNEALVERAAALRLRPADVVRMAVAQAVADAGHATQARPCQQAQEVAT